MKSLDPRVNRLPPTGVDGIIIPKAPLDQFGNFEVFVQPKEGKAFQHEGSIHAPNLEMAYVLAKETLTRRFTCSALAVVDTRNVFVSALTDDNHNVYDAVTEVIEPNSNEVNFEIYHLLKRGRQHIHAGQLKASTPLQALVRAKEIWCKGKVVFNVWAIRTQDIRTTTADEKEFWLTLPDKKFRDASDYKGGDKLKYFLEKKQP